MKKLLLLLLFLVSTAYGDALKGYDTLGIAMSDPHVIAANARPGTVIGALAGTFGNTIAPMDIAITESHGNIVGFRAHLGNGSCQRSHNCAPGEPGPTDLKTMASRATAYEHLKDKYPSITCYLSPRLEHDEKNVNLVNSWIATIRKAAPNCIPVISAVSGYRPPGVLQEYHGSNNKGDIVSSDGNSIYDCDTSSFWSHGRMISMAWIPAFNLRISGETHFTMPKQRPKRYAPSAYDFQWINRLMEPVAPIPPSPPPCKVIVSIKPPDIWKPSAENHDNGDSRAGKIVFLTSAKGEAFSLLRSDGQPVACLKRYDPNFSKVNRYYLGTCSSKNNLQVMDLAQNEWVFVKNGNTCFQGSAIRRLGVTK